MAADSKPFIRGGLAKKYKGSLGTCLGFTQPEDFKSIYDDAINTILNSTGTARDREVLKSYDISKLFENDRSGYLSSLGSFVSVLAENEININAVFTTFNTQLLPEGIKKYGTGRYPLETKKPLEFLDELTEFYPYIATWKVSKTAFLKGINLYLDSFTGEFTKAWGELCTHHKVYVIPKGDSCNPFISSADLVTKYIDEYLSQNHLPLNEPSIKLSFNACGATKAHTFYVGHGELDNIVPIRKEKINLLDHYKRPMIYILKEQIIQSETDFIEKSPLWNKLLNFACNKNSGIKFISYEEDHRNIKDGDYLIYLGDQGKKQAEYLKKLGYGVAPVSALELEL